MTPTVDVATWLQRSSTWLFLSQAFERPTPETVDSLRALATTLPEALREPADALATEPLDSAEPEYFSVLGPAGCAAAESSYERAAMAARGPLLAEVAGFYEAFHYTPPHTQDVPDHISVELGFLAYLACKVAFALFERQQESAEIASTAYDTFLREHPGAWAGPFVDALLATGSDRFGAAAFCLRTVMDDAGVGQPVAAE